MAGGTPSGGQPKFTRERSILCAPASHDEPGKEYNTMSAGLSDFFRYNLWANQALLDSCEPLSDAQLDATAAGVYGSVRAILMHLFSSEESYAGRVGGQAPGQPLKESDDFSGFGELRRRAEQSGQA